MRNLKLYEDFKPKQYRTVDLADLYFQSWKFRGDLESEFIPYKKWTSIDDIWNEFVIELLQDKEILILSDNFFGRVKEATITLSKLRLYFYEGKIKVLDIGLMGPKKTVLIRIYNSEPTKLEKEIELLKNVKKFNL